MHQKAMPRRAAVILFFIAISALPAIFGQQSGSVSPTQPAPSTSADENGSSPGAESQRIFGIIPNFRTSPTLEPYKPVTPKEKLKIASQDAFDRGTVALSALFAGQSQLANSNPSFGQGVKGYARYLGTAYADFFIGDYMTEAIYPSLLHQDPRYFRKGIGSGWSRLGYAMGQVFWTHTDSGGTQFNYSEVIGNST